MTVRSIGCTPSGPTPTARTRRSGPTCPTPSPPPPSSCTATALRAHAVEEDEVGARHFRIAGRIARLDAVSSDPSERTRRARRGYYLLAAWSLAGRLDVTPLFFHLETALGAFPDSPELLLASASLEELFLDLEGRGRPTPVRTNATTVRQEAALRGARQSALAEALYARAIAAASSDPSSQVAGLEARVRLARMHLRSRQAADARRELDAAFETFGRLDSAYRRAVRRIEYLAHLFAGRVAGEAGDWPEARRAYAQAGVLCVMAQSAPIGQSFALLMAADEAGARGMTAAMLAMPDRPAPNSAAPTDLCSGDPWIGYPSGQEWRLDGMLADLRAMVRS